jgi:Tfp pilus assembly protein PilZ
MAEQMRRQKRLTRIVLSKLVISGEKHIGYIQDFSLLGIGITCNKGLEKKAQVDVMVQLPNLSALTLPGVVIWRRKLPKVSRHKYLYGVRFAEAPREYKEFIESELEKAENKREHGRLRYFMHVKTDDVLKLIDAATEDISAGGMYIRSQQLLNIGEDITLSLEDERLEKPITCMGKVVSCFECDTNNFDYPYGSGIKIIAFQKGDEGRFKDFLVGLEDLFSFSKARKVGP